MDKKKLKDLIEAINQFRLSRTTRGSHESLRNDHADEGFSLIEQALAVILGDDAEPVAGLAPAVIVPPAEKTEDDGDAA